MRRITSALFLDFDNIFGGLLSRDRDVALAFAKDPARLIRGLETAELEADTRRDLLVRKAYLNPHGAALDPSASGGRARIVLSRFRRGLVAAGFEVIDCPPLTPQHKNAADIRIVIDALTALTAAVRYDEVIVASSDADFTPLLQRLRAEDRRTMIVTAGPMAPGYKTAADRHVDESRLIDLLRSPAPTPADAPPDEPERPTTGADEQITGQTATPPELGLEEIDQAAARTKVRIRTLVEAAEAPLHLGALGALLHKEDGDAIRASKWFGARTLAAFALAAEPELRAEGYHLWHPSRHRAPETARPG